MRVLGDRVLVKLAPVPALSAGGLELAPAFTAPSCMGKVVQVGPRVHDVRVGQIVVFPPEVGDDAGLPIPHLFLREQEITAKMEAA